MMNLSEEQLALFETLVKVCSGVSSDKARGMLPWELMRLEWPELCTDAALQTSITQYKMYQPKILHKSSETGNELRNCSLL